MPSLDFPLISGETVIVARPEMSTDVDEMGEPIAGEPTREAVGNVLFDPTASSDVSGNLRLASIEVDADFHFPKTYTESLRGCSIEHGGRTYQVIGDIRRYTEANVPGQWNGVVSCKEVS